MSTTAQGADRAATRQALEAIASCHRAEGERALGRFQALRAAGEVGLPEELRVDPEALGTAWDRAYAVCESGVYA
jgi:hypothetical protein